jgi:isochorismate synthase
MTPNDFFESAQQFFDDALPFVLYRKPNKTNLKGFFQKDDVVYKTADFTESGFVFSPFDSEEDSILFPESSCDVVEVNDDVVGIYQSNPKHSHISTIDEVSKTAYISKVTDVIDAIKKGDFVKVVWSRAETIHLKASNPIVLFKRLLESYSTAFVYCWYHPKIGLWLGATPETLLQVSGNRFQTMSLAGTQTVSSKQEWKSKETEEQQLVTNYVQDQLKTVVTDLQVSNVETIQAGELLHLRTKISGTLNSGLKTIIKTLHPTPAVCGLPKEASKTYILNHENYNREFYTGFLGELNLKEEKSRNTNRRNVENNAYSSIKTISHLFVNLRCMQLTDTKATVYVGGGITKDSIAENEWEETCNKAETMKKVLF